MGMRCEKARLTSNVGMIRKHNGPARTSNADMAGVVSKPKHAARGDRRIIITLVAKDSHVYENS